MPKPDYGPREKAKAFGLLCCSDSELLALLLSSGSCKENVFCRSSRVLFESGNLTTLFHLGEGALNRFSLPPMSRLRIRVVGEICRRINREKHISFPNSSSVFHYLEKEIADLSCENVWVFFLSRAKVLLFAKRYESRFDSYCSIPIKEIQSQINGSHCKFIVLAHNHPSNCLVPSKLDWETFSTIGKMVEKMGIVLLDSLIVSEKDYFSMAAFLEKGKEKRLETS
jgi:DNA repair protein RadC